MASIQRAQADEVVYNAVVVIVGSGGGGGSLEAASERAITRAAVTQAIWKGIRR